MGDEQGDGGSELERKVERLSAQVASNRADLDALQVRADESNHRASRGEDASAEHERRIDLLETRVDVDREIITELQAAGVLVKEHAAHLEEALRSSRRIGAAIGIVMASRKVSEEVAFAMLKAASQHTNRKVRVLADEMVRTGDVSGMLGT